MHHTISKYLLLLFLISFKGLPSQSVWAKKLAPPIFQVPESRLVKATGPEIYLIDSGRRRIISNSETIDVLDVGPVIPLSNAELNAIPMGEPYPSLPNRIIRSDAPLPLGQDPQVFFVQGGKRRLIPDRMTLYNLDLGEPSIIPDRDLQAITIFTPFPQLPSSLLKASGPQIYQIEKGKRKLVPYPNGALISASVKVVSNAILNSLPLSTPYTPISANAPAQPQLTFIVCWFRSDEFGRQLSQTFGQTSDSRHNEDAVNAGGAYSLSDPTGRIYSVVYNCQGAHCGFSNNPDGGYSEKIQITSYGSSFSWRRLWSGQPVGETYTAMYEVPRKLARSTCPAGSHP